MKKVALIAALGMLGGMLRFTIGASPVSMDIPYITLGINMAGSMALAFVVRLIWFHSHPRRKQIADGIAVGFLGAFTTFSAVCKQVYGMFEKGQVWQPLIYVLISVLFGLLAAYIGSLAAGIFDDKPTILGPAEESGVPD